MRDILVVCEVADGRVKKSARELLGKAKELADGGNVSALLIGADVGDGADLACWGADTIVKVESGDLATYVPLAYAKAVAAAADDKRADLVLASASSLGKDLLPRVAALLGAGCVSDAVDVRDDGGDVVATRPLYAGKVLADARIEGTPALISVRPNSFVPGAVDAGAGDVESLDADLAADGYTVAGVTKSGGDKVDLTEAERIISGGRSLKAAENFAILHKAANVIGAAVGASRAAVDAGYAPHAMQVGQTGKTVNPSLYIACGISGAIQHLAGMRTSKVIVAINKDPEAPIFQHATYGIVGDLFEVVPMLEAEFRKVVAD
jgi:electron transfer flavoprotein alpha subunit